MVRVERLEQFESVLFLLLKLRQGADSKQLELDCDPPHENFDNWYQATQSKNALVRTNSYRHMSVPPSTS